MTELSNAVHKKFNTPKEILHEVDGLQFPFNPEWETIAVNLSGGADSAMCTYTLAKLIEDLGCNTKIKIITHSRVWEGRPWQSYISEEVYEYLKARFPTIIDERIENFIPPRLEEASAGSDLLDGKSGDRIIVHEFNRYAQFRYGIEISYNAVTANPPQDEFEHNKSPIDRNQTNIDDITNNKVISETTICPFSYVDKFWIIKQYYDNDLLDLLNLTRSCEGDTANMPDRFHDDYTTYVHGESPLPVCGECFWCIERQWAVDKVNASR